LAFDFFIAIYDHQSVLIRQAALFVTQMLIPGMVIIAGFALKSQIIDLSEYNWIQIDLYRFVLPMLRLNVLYFS